MATTVTSTYNTTSQDLTAPWTIVSSTIDTRAYNGSTTALESLSSVITLGTKTLPVIPTSSPFNKMTSSVAMATTTNSVPMTTRYVLNQDFTFRLGLSLAIISISMFVVAMMLYVRWRCAAKSILDEEAEKIVYNAIENEYSGRIKRRMSSLRSLLMPKRNSSDDSKNILTMKSENLCKGSPMVIRSVHHGTIPFVVPAMKNHFSPGSIENNVQPTMNDCSPNLKKNSETSNISEDSLDFLSEISETVPKSPTSYGRGTSVSSTVSWCSNDSGLVSPSQYQNSLIGKIQPELYKFSQDETNCDILPRSERGRLWFSIVYDAAVETLTVKDIKVKQLPDQATGVAHDSFVKLFILPDERISQQTKVKRRTNNPKFNETFVFQVSEEDIRTRTLRFSVYDVDKRKVARHLLGHALVLLGGIDLSQSNELIWRDLSEIAHPGDSGSSLGEIKVSLSYLPSMNRLNVVVLRMRNLREIDLESTGVYVKVSLAQGHRVIRSKKTALQRGECDPAYNESFSFTVTAKNMPTSCVKISVVMVGCYSGLRQLTSSMKNIVNSGRASREHRYGRVVIGSHMYCRGEQLLHWQEMVDEARKSVAKWHPLSPIHEE